MALKDILGEELYNQVEAKINAVNANQTDKAKRVKLVDLSEGGYVSAAKYDDLSARLNQQITQLQNQATQRDADLNSLSERLTAAQADTSKLADAQTALTNMQNQYNADKEAWSNQMKKQTYEFAVKTEAGKLRFSSEAAKRDFIRGAIEKNMQMEGENILGFTDYVNAYKTADPSAFAVEKKPDEAPKPEIVAGNSGQPNPTPQTFGWAFNGVRPRPEK